jgi:hypothetical protein
MCADTYFFHHPFSGGGGKGVFFKEPLKLIKKELLRLIKNGAFQRGGKKRLFRLFKKACPHPF